jgi:exoribonuclease-2
VPFDLSASAHDEMIHEGFAPDFPPEIREQVTQLRLRPAAEPQDNVQDLRALPWSSIDNDTSRDLDQIEVAEQAGDGTRVRIGIADVTAMVEKGSPIDGHATRETTSVYTPSRTFPMLPEELSTDMTSLNENQDRLSVVIEFVAAQDGSIGSPKIYRAWVRNKAQLTYNAAGPWLEGKGPMPVKVAAAEWQAQLKLQDAAARALRAQRYRLGALNFDRVEAVPVISDGRVEAIVARPKNRAGDLIEDFMIAANEVMAATLKNAGVASIRRVVKTPERWPRIVELARNYGESLPEQPDSGALSAFLQKRRTADPVHYPDLSLGVMKLMGPGEYVMGKPGDPGEGHFGLAAHDYTHSTAPNRRFADMVVQRLVKSVLSHRPPPYSSGELTDIARNCTLKEDAARKVERSMGKRVAALAVRNQIGQGFDAVVTGVTPKGTFVRVLTPPIEGRLMRGEAGVDVGDRLRVTLLSADPQRGFIDFGRA